MILSRSEEAFLLMTINGGTCGGWWNRWIDSKNSKNSWQGISLSGNKDMIILHVDRLAEIWVMETEWTRACIDMSKSQGHHDFHKDLLDFY